MTIDIQCELGGIRMSADIKTLSVEAHSALTEVPKEEVEQVRRKIQRELLYLVERSAQCRKDLG